MAVCCAFPANIGTLGGGTGPLIVLRLPAASKATRGNAPITPGKRIFRTRALNETIATTSFLTSNAVSIISHYQPPGVTLFSLPEDDGLSIVPGCFSRGRDRDGTPCCRLGSWVILTFSL